jgi:hypothetical protein
MRRLGKTMERANGQEGKYQFPPFYELLARPINQE